MPRRRRPRRRSYFWLFVALIKRNPVRSATAAIVILGGIVPAVKGIQYLDELTDPWQPASHPFVYKQVDTVDKKAVEIGTKNQTILRDVQIDVNAASKRIAAADMRKWKLELEKTTLDQTQREYVQQQYDDAKTTFDALTGQERTLKQVRGAAP